MIYLDNAATSFPKPAIVHDRISEVLSTIGGNPGRSSHTMAIEAARVIFNARESVASLIGASDSGRIAFTKNATEAINTGLKGILKPGDHVVTSAFEHNSVVKSLARLASGGVEVTKVSPDKEGFLRPRDIEAAIKKNTKMVCISHASNVFGAIQHLSDIGKVCRSKNAMFMVDGAQTIGAMPFDVTAFGVDILAATGHKALFGPQGTGFLYLAEGIDVVPLVDGGTGEAGSPLEMPELLEAGTMNTPGIGGLGAGVRFLLDERVEKIREKEEGLIDAVLKGFASMKGISIIGPADASRRAALVSFNIDGKKPGEVGLRLDDEAGIMIRCGTHCAPDAHRCSGTFPDGAARVSPGYFNTAQDIEEFLKAVRAVAKG
ncbi:MAG: aminotransferase class V-fold PLP-dependent enzyme [Deltaproteobacteria bacterium]|nr:aminotransferase class V-fold PLP-dependent enzyme [Deltaproteobacteria bacterium]